MTITFAFLHHLAFVAMFVGLAGEMMLLRQPFTLEVARRLQVYDGIYGGAAGIVLLVGGIRVFFLEKGYYYYLTNHAFLTKIALFVIVAALSVIPTMEYMRWRAATSAGKVPQIDAAKMERIRKLLHWQLLGLMLMLFFAAWMARGSFR